MNEKPKQTVARKSRKTEAGHSVSVLEQFQCSNVNYDFEIPVRSFKVRSFQNKTGIGMGDNWSTVLSSEPRSGYHVHFRGNIDKQYVRMTIEYWDGTVKRTKNHPEPSSETIMHWVGSFLRDPSQRAVVLARFEKSNEAWRSRFNLPFKVTMAGEEVVIDGVSLALPKNKFRALDGWLTKLDRVLAVSVAFIRPVEFAKFSLGADLVSFNEAIKLFVEPLT